MPKYGGNYNQAVPQDDIPKWSFCKALLGTFLSLKLASNNPWPAKSIYYQIFSLTLQLMLGAYVTPWTSSVARKTLNAPRIKGAHKHADANQDMFQCISKTYTTMNAVSSLVHVYKARR